MSFIDGNMVFGLPAITNSTSATISTNVIDVGSAKKVFASPICGYVCFETAVTADASPSIKVDLVGDSNANLTTTPIVLGSSGVIATDEAGVALVSGGIVRCAFPVGGQTATRQFYGLIATLGGTNPDIVAGAKQGYFTPYPQTNMLNERAAVP